jgi:hypothetical protein
VQALARDARAVTREVMEEGGQLSADLQEMSASLRRNAERLLRDVRDAHSRLSAALDRTIGPETAPPPSGAGGRRARRVAVEGEVDVPEFLPPS